MKKGRALRKLVKRLKSLYDWLIYYNDSSTHFTCRILNYMGVNFVDVTEKNKKKKSLWGELMDSIFIMILCFATLLTAMLMASKLDREMNYVIDFKTLGVVVAGLVTYLVYVLYNSDKELKEMIHQLYQDKDVTDIEKKEA